MKNLLERIYMTTVLTAALFAGCTPEEETVAPNFPVKQTYFVNLEEDNVVSIPVSPNQDWSASIPAASSNYFMLLNGEQQTLSVGGGAGDAEIRVICLANEQDLEEHSVDVTMRIGSESAVIATVTLASSEPVFNIRTAEVNEDENGNPFFVPAAEGSDFAYIYPDENILGENDAVDMYWDASENGYIAYIQVEANFSWSPEDFGSLVIRSVNETGHFNELKIFCPDVNYSQTGGNTKTVSFNLTSGTEGEETNTCRLSVPPFHPELEIFAVTFNEDGSDFQTGEDPYMWVFGETALDTDESIGLIWRPASSVTTVDTYILVKSNFSPVLSEDNTPSWMTAEERLIEKTAYGYEAVYHLDAVSSELVRTGNTGTLAFSVGPYSEEYPVATEDISDILYIGSISTFEFDGNGRYSPSSTMGTSASEDATMELTSSAGLSILEFVMDDSGNYIVDEPSGWITAKYGWNTGSEAVIQTNTLTISVSPNDGEYRQGLIMAFPESVLGQIESEGSPEDVLFDDMGNVRDEYEQYVAAYVKQEKFVEETGVIIPIEPDMWLYEMAKFEVLDSDPTGSGITDCYKITYAAPVASRTDVLNSLPSLQFDVDARVDHIIAKGTDNKEIELTDDYWLQVKLDEEDGYYHVEMAPYGIEDPELFVIFVDKDGKNLALVHCCYDPEAQISDVVLSFYPGVPTDGLTLTKLASTDPAVPSGIGAGCYWLLEYDGTESIQTAIQGIPSNVASFQINPYGSELVSASRLKDGVYQIDFNLPLSAADAGTQCLVNFHDSANYIPVCLVCRLKPEPDEEGGQTGQTF